jgi:hypothetical protein
MICKPFYLNIRFFDKNASDDKKFVKIFCHGEHNGMFVRQRKASVEIEGTTIVPTRNKWYEIRIRGEHWRQVKKEVFEKLLQKVNDFRNKQGWVSISLPGDTESK